MERKPAHGVHLEGHGTVALVATDDALVFKRSELDAPVAGLAVLAFMLGGPILGMVALLVILLPHAAGREVRRVPFAGLTGVTRSGQTYAVTPGDRDETVVFHVRSFHTGRVDEWLSAATGEPVRTVPPDALRDRLPAETLVDEDAQPAFLERLVSPRTHLVAATLLALGAAAGVVARLHWVGGPWAALLAAALFFSGTMVAAAHRGLAVTADLHRERLLRSGVRPPAPVPAQLLQADRHAGRLLFPFVHAEIDAHPDGLAVLARPYSGPQIVFMLGGAAIVALGAPDVVPRLISVAIACAPFICMGLPGRRHELTVVTAESVQSAVWRDDCLHLERGGAPSIVLRPKSARRVDLTERVARALPGVEVAGPPDSERPDTPATNRDLDESLARLRSLQGK